ncbi:glycosyltransferase family 4 protein [Rapidithrix thailandica]|uniref:Glycosyltransferase family 4 protein n=1 Tax=Rapidithrix thailandica TaxID=413964 RepID=A0AAW9S8G3_9BACT
MKIAFISNHLPPTVDGVGDYVYHLGQEFVQNGHEVSVLCKALPEIEAHFQRNSSGIQVYPIVKSWDFSAISTLLKTLKEIRPDWVLLQYVPYSFNYFGVPYWMLALMVTLKWKRYKVGITFHEIAIRIAFSKPKYLPISLSQRLIAYGMSLLSDVDITSVNRYIRMLRLPFKTDARKVPIGSNVFPGKEENTPKGIVNKDYFLLCSFGSNPRKNELLLGVLQELIREGVPAKLLLLGKLKPEVKSRFETLAQEKQVSEYLELTGYLPGEQLFEKLQTADVFLLMEDVNSKGWGGISTKSGSLSAAYLAGLPIISTKGDMTDSFFQDQQNILLTGTCEVQKVKELVLQLYFNPELKERLRKNARMGFEQNLSWSKIYLRYREELGLELTQEEATKQQTIPVTTRVFSK